jgi:hypothetical protein
MTCVFYILYGCKQLGYEVVLCVIKMATDVCCGQLLLQADVKTVPQIRL